MEQKCVKFTVFGVVQGVGFRYHTCHQGLKFGLTGYAKNLMDGSVEVVVCGNEQKVTEMAAWLEQGPQTATVDSVVSEPMSFKPFRGFKIL